MFIRRYRLLAPDENGLAAAISAGIEQASPTSSSDNEVDTAPPADETPAAAEPNGGGDDAPAADGAPAADPQAPEGEAAPASSSAPASEDRGDGRDASGRFISKKGAQDPAAAPEGAAPAKPQAPVKADPVNDPIPADLKGKTRERMVSLVSAAKDLTRERDDFKTKHDAIWNAIAETRTTPDQFSDVMSALTLLNSDDAAQRRQGIQAFRKILDGAASEIGEVPEGKELEGHPDLQEDVEAGDMSRERAIELAKARNRDKAESSRREKQEAQTREQREHAAAVKSARDEIVALGTELRRANPSLFATRANVVAKLFLKVRDDLHPSKWAAKYRELYEDKTLNLGPVDTRQRVPRGTGGLQPMRPAQPAGGGGPRAMGSVEEAISWGINQANRR